jgi:hypothetical protein
MVVVASVSVVVAFGYSIELLNALISPVHVMGCGRTNVKCIARRGCSVFTNVFDDKPMSGWRSAWRSLTRSINCPACGQPQDPGTKCRTPKCNTDISKVKSSTAGLRFHDLHHAITELAESHASDRTVMAIARQVSQRMLAHYSHVRIESGARTARQSVRPKSVTHVTGTLCNPCVRAGP